MTLENAPAASAQPNDSPQLPPASPKSKRGWITPVLGVVAALAIGLLGGVVIGQRTASATNTAVGEQGSDVRGGTGFANRPNVGGGQGGFSAGTIDSIDGNSLVITLADGTKLTVAATDSTTVTTSVPGTVDDLKVGERITVVGQTSGDTLTATSINEGGQFESRPGGPESTPAPADSGK
jgi:hypothetical protein